MANVKNGKVVNSNYMRSKFGEGVTITPIKSANDQGGGCASSTCSACVDNFIPCIGTGSSGCGSSNKIQVYKI